MSTHKRRRGPVRVPIQTSGRPNQLGSDKKIINFAVPFKQWAASSEKSQAGRVFNVADFMRLLHKHLFVNRPLREAQAIHRRLIEMDKQNGGRATIDVSELFGTPTGKP